MDKVKSTRHSRYHINYHIVWIPKYRRKVLVGHVASRAEEILRQIAKAMAWEIVALEVMPDHVHLFVSAPPKFSPADIVKRFKGVSARQLLLEFPELAKRTGQGTLWAPSYYIGTAGAVSAEIIKRYIEECQDH
ncbi:transposase IS200 [Desulforamulus profundi]|uniref:Transposase IS200 n=1 Tax=Desulforamulus profundi TaxID=1383067 RepID=A0A2C6LL19_9FIRM|nr:IS200/IS605 family transposase [Desulforamulus profundi]PHJ39290.1 transposase IS200 [Desulforamulus profundi]